MTLVDWIGFAAYRLIAVSIGVSVLLLVMAWRRRDRVLAHQAALLSAMPVSRFELSRTPFAGGMLDVASEISAVLARLAPIAAREFVQLEVAAQPDLVVRADSRALREALGDLVSSAIRHAPCGRVLVGAMRHSGRVQISVTDDGAGPPGATQEAVLRDAERLIALQGGTMQVEAQTRDGGSTVLLRLPEPQPGRADLGSAAPPTELPEQSNAATMVWNR